jgi:hypothetical protein
MVEVDAVHGSTSRGCAAADSTFVLRRSAAADCVCCANRDLMLVVVLLPLLPVAVAVVDDDAAAAAASAVAPVGDTGSPFVELLSFEALLLFELFEAADTDDDMVDGSNDTTATGELLLMALVMAASAASRLAFDGLPGPGYRTRGSGCVCAC